MEVKEHLPMAVGIQPNVIPNEMRILTDISWNDTTLYTNLSDCSGVKYRFMLVMILVVMMNVWKKL